MDDTKRWRTLADSFPCLTRMVAGKRIPADYTPKTLKAKRYRPGIDLCGHAALSTSERSVFSFLLHVWNQYDHSFTLSDTLIWDTGHRKAFVSWANGRTLGEPLRYF
jgi:hypothetical protein